MSVLYISAGMHHKNNISILNYKNINFTTTNTINNIDLSLYDVVYSPATPINASLYPKTKFIFGPHFNVFPDHNINIIKSERTTYIQPSDWVSSLWRNNTICQNLNISTMPFGVDTIKFNESKPRNERNNVFIYHKARAPHELKYIESFLISKNINYKILSYSGKYSETDYLNYLKDSKYGIWLGCHESQGFALQEALSCNVPLLVWNVTSMNQEYGQSYSNIPATTLPYWDERCGEFFYKNDELEKTFDILVSKLESYSPREYILENLSMDVCENKFKKLL